MSWHQDEGLFAEFIRLWLVSGDLNSNNSRSHSLPSLINESIKWLCHTAVILLLTKVEGQQIANCDHERWLYFGSTKEKDLQSPFKQNAPLVSQAGKLLSVKKQRPLQLGTRPSATPDSRGCCCCEDNMNSTQKPKVIHPHFILNAIPLGHVLLILPWTGALQLMRLR